MSFLRSERRGVQVHRLADLEETGLVQAVVSHRFGGVSQGPYRSLNLGFHVGDEEQRVRENRRRFLAALDLDPAAVVTAEQVHGDRIVRVTKEDGGRGALERGSAVRGADGLITDTPGLVLLALYADCVPIFLLDPLRPAIGLAHAGWRGTVLRVAEKTVAAMSREFGSDPGKCRAALGPSIGPCCYEVDDKVLQPLSEALPYWCQLVEPAVAGADPGAGRRTHLDLWTANARQLKEAGIPSANISVSRLCTSCQKDFFFSHRAEGGQTGRFGALLTLRKERAT
ncbi:MAG: peptidoglycan editing factor PgeF [Firmicutes bacterium]|nr:peptidoglycan editing factor PgeF [Bacillota bacterium]MCL5040794.1 peptidoglycan editing factor PgeF [Bacillota bacterium]